MHLTEHTLVNRSQNHPSRLIRLRRKNTFVASVLLSVLVNAACLGADSAPATGKGKGRVTIVYQDDAIQPENRDAIKKIRDSGVFERMADRLTKAVALPHDLQVVVTDKLPKGFDDPTTETDGGKIWWPAAFSKATHDILTEFLPEVIPSKGPPRAISKENFTADVLNVWGNQFILGHELGHALMHQLNVPPTGMEEDSADGFATFFTVNDKDTGPNAALGAAVLFDAMGSKRPNLTLEDFSSDHPVILQRVYNFLCAVVGSDPQRLQNPLVTDGYIPQTRALLSRKEWTQLNYGWWTVLEPHITDNSKKETKAARQQARKDLEDEKKALPANRFAAGSATTNQSLGFFFGTVWNDGIDSSMTTHGNLSSRKIAFCGANGAGSSNDAIVTSIMSESLASSKNKCVPQHAANERSRFAYAILRGSPFVRTRSLRGTDPHCTYGAPTLRRQSMQ